MYILQVTILTAVIALHLLVPVRAGSSSPQTISLDKSVHFSAPDGSDVVTDAGDYEVNAEAPGLRLISELGGNSTGHLIDAIVTEIDIEAHEPLALTVRLREDEYHIILLMPGKKVHEAVGSSSGILTRGTVYKPLTAAQIKAALAKKQPLTR